MNGGDMLKAPSLLALSSQPGSVVVKPLGLACVSRKIGDSPHGCPQKECTVWFRVPGVVNRSRYRALLLAGLFCLWGGRASGQVSSGEITGIVTDPSGAVLPDAKVTATDAATNVSTIATTNGSGNYALLYLVPGIYTLRVEHAGFKELVRNGIAVRVGDQWKLNLQLTFGAVAEVVTVRAPTPLLQNNDADLGETVTQAQLANMPLRDGDPLLLAKLQAGAVDTGSPQFTRPFDNGDVGGFRVNGAEPGGASNSNQFSLNGVSDNGVQPGHGSTVAYIAPSESVQEIRVSTSTFSAMWGNTTGSHVSITTKSGSNQLHGSLYEFWRNTLLDANGFFENANSTSRQVVHYNRFGGTLGGPVVLPKLYNGRDKTFFFFAYENLPDTFPESHFYTVPTQAERQGDFSGLLTCDKGPVVVYNPFDYTVDSNGIAHRQPFTGNTIPQDKLSPIALKMEQAYPLPNVTTSDPCAGNNYFTQNSRTDRFHTYLTRMDHLISSRQSLTGTYFANWRRENRESWTRRQEVAGTNILPSGDYLYFINHGGTLSDVLTLSSTSVLNLRGGFNRFVFHYTPPSLGFDPASLGFPPSVTSLFGAHNYFPKFTVDNFSAPGPSETNTVTATNTYSLDSTYTKIFGRHTFNMGYDFQLLRWNIASKADLEGSYTFSSNYTTQCNRSTSSDCFGGSTGQFGQAYAGFLLGLPTKGDIQTPAQQSDQGIYHALFFQDDWKVTNRLTLNLGLRWELEQPTTERFNRSTRGFDLTDPNPIAAQAEAAFAKDFPNGFVIEPGLPPITAANFHALGGYLFASSQNRQLFQPQFVNLQPRFGFAYELFRRTVVRGGYAVYSVPFFAGGPLGVNQTGFSAQTDIVSSVDNHITPSATLANPWPNGLIQPSGSALGLRTDLGNAVTFMPLNLKIGHAARWTFDIEQELPGKWLIDAAYVGSYGYHLKRSGAKFLGAIPPQYLSTSPIRDDNINTELTKKVSNPFYGLVPLAATLGPPTINAESLVRAFPEFNGISTTEYNGTNYFNALELKVEHRFSQGYELFVNYTWSKLLERYGFLNDYQIEPTKATSLDDVPNHFTVVSISQLPFGRGRRFGRHWPGWLVGILGGWQGEGIYAYQQGRPMALGNVAYFGDPNTLRAHVDGQHIDSAFDTSGFYDNGLYNYQSSQINLVYNNRTFPSILPRFRGDSINNVDASAIKKFTIAEGKTLEVRVDAFNALNRPQFSNPDVKPRDKNFSQISSQSNLSREFELGVKFAF